MKVKLYVSDNRVNCPRRGDIDVETCWSCPNLGELAEERDKQVVVCVPQPKRDMRARFFAHW